MSWIIPSSLTNRGNRRYAEFLDKCEDDNVINNSVPIIDETDSKYFPYIENTLPIPKLIDDTKKKKIKNKLKNKSIHVIEYITAMSKEHEKISPKPKLGKQILTTIQQKKRKRKKLLQ